MDGFFLIDKPSNMSSMDLCFKLKKKLGLNKCGHNGTLDPDATGLMVVASNKATKLIKLIEGFDKTYIAKIVFGLNSDTLDIFGNITENISMDVNLDKLNEAIDVVASLKEQIPPLISAIKIDGHKLWWYQKNKIEIDVPKRQVRVLDYKLIDEPILVNDHYECSILLHVDKGYYIRSFARDLGEALGGCAIIKELRRTKNGSFTIENSKSINDINENDLISIFDLFKDLEVLEVSDYIAKLVSNGVTLDERQLIAQKPFFVKNKDNIIAMYECVSKNKYKPIIIF